MLVRVLRSWDGLPVGEPIELDDKQAYSRVLQGFAEYVQPDEKREAVRLVKEWQGHNAGTVINVSQSVSARLTISGVGEVIRAEPHPVEVDVVPTPEPEAKVPPAPKPTTKRTSRKK